MDALFAGASEETRVALNLPSSSAGTLNRLHVCSCELVSWISPWISFVITVDIVTSTYS